ncbi:MAG: NDP-hexose 4-ketoreductase, partial [Actinobacteria bacterium]
LAYADIKSRVTGELKSVFRPEFLNRVDEVIVFHDLAGDEIEQIVDLMVSRTREQLMLHGMGIVLTEEARSMLAKEGFDPALGARPLRRAIQRLIEDPLSEQILAGQWQAGDVIEAYPDGEGALAFRRGEGIVAVPARVKTPPAETDKPIAPARRSGGRGRGGQSAGGASGE